jgi:K+-sensing histidine kinase KdpD
MGEGLEIVPRRTMTYRGATLTEMDLDAVLARHPRVALVDELAHANVPGCRNAKRWQDVDELLTAGIDVITTLNIQHLPRRCGACRSGSPPISPRRWVLRSGASTLRPATGP